MFWLRLPAILPSSARVRRWGCCVGMLLAGQPGQATGQPQAANPALPTARATQQPTEPLAPLIRQLLDTAAVGGLQAADARLALQAGAEVRAFYGSTYTPAWTQPADTLNADALAALKLLARALDYGLPADYLAPGLQSLRDSLWQGEPVAGPSGRTWQLARLEVALSDAVLRFGRDLSRGRLRPFAPTAREKAQGPAGQPAAVLRAALGTGRLRAALLARQPANREYRQLQQALARWVARVGGPDSVARHPKSFERAAVNLERWRWEVFSDAEYVLINLPAYELQVLARDSVQRRHRVVIGKPETPTPTLSSDLCYFTLAPNWHVPNSIATLEMLPRMQKDPGYLADNNYALYNAKGQRLNPFHVKWALVTPEKFPYTIRQSPCCDNALGNIVFRFANPYAVYLHDTPKRQLFKLPARALSHGCVRVAEPLQLAAYLLLREGRQMELPSEKEFASQLRPRPVRLTRPLPLHIRYATCVAEKGRLRFFTDVYSLDEPVRTALFGPGPVLQLADGKVK